MKKTFMVNMMRINFILRGELLLWPLFTDILHRIVVLTEIKYSANMMRLIMLIAEGTSSGQLRPRSRQYCKLVR